MFRKPKKNPKAKFRSRKRTAQDQDQDDEQAKRFRNNDQADSSTPDHDDGEHDASTSDLLQQIKNEKNQKKKVSKYSNNDNDNDDADADGARGKKSLMQQYASTDKPSDQDIATRTAQHHPEEQSTKETGNDSNGGGMNMNTNTNQNEQEDKKLYKGTKEARNKFLAGPLKAPTFVRTTSRFDYQPDICKDYKDTGFCGFGDSCIYLHDRGNTMSGWQLEEEYEKKKKEAQDAKQREMDLFCREIGGGGKNGDMHTDTDTYADGATGSGDITADGLPFACYLCREAFKDPVVTSCNHYFCQNCIMQHVKDNSTNGSSGSVSASMSSACPICQKDTHGVFNYASKLYQKRRRMGFETWEDYAAKNSGG